MHKPQITHRIVRKLSAQATEKNQKPTSPAFNESGKNITMWVELAWIHTYVYMHYTEAFIFCDFPTHTDYVDPSKNFFWRSKLFTGRTYHIVP